MAVKNCFIRGSVVRYVQLPAEHVDTQLLEDATRRGQFYLGFLPRIGAHMFGSRGGEPGEAMMINSTIIHYIAAASMHLHLIGVSSIPRTPLPYLRIHWGCGEDSYYPHSNIEYMARKTRHLYTTQTNDRSKNDLWPAWASKRMHEIKPSLEKR